MIIWRPSIGLQFDLGDRPVSSLTFIEHAAAELLMRHFPATKAQDTFTLSPSSKNFRIDLILTS